jgi:hypothetical protein
MAWDDNCPRLFRRAVSLSWTTSPGYPWAGQPRPTLTPLSLCPLRMAHCQPGLVSFTHTDMVSLHRQPYNILISIYHYPGIHAHSWLLTG